MLLLKAQNISHKFDYQLFENINIEIKAKETIAIIGKSGSGKSTLLHILSTLLEPLNGTVSLFNQNISKLSQDEILELRREKIGIIFQSHYLFRGFKVSDNLEIASLLSGIPIDRELLKKFDILHTLNQDIGELSGGEQQRVSIARALIKKPKIIFADEPTGNLDTENAKIVINSLKDYVKNSDSAMFLVTHDIELANLCDKVYELKDLHLNKINTMNN